MATSTGTIVAVLVGIVALVIFLPRIMPQLQNALGSIGGAQTSTSTGGGGGTFATGDQTATAGPGTGRMTDVAGNGCACSGGVCEGNCSDMEQIDLENFDPLDWVRSRV